MSARQHFVVPPALHPLDLDAAAGAWQLALDGAGRALRSSDGAYLPAEHHRRLLALARERSQTELLLGRLAASAGVRHTPWLSSTPLTAAALGLQTGVRACIFDLDGVLTDSADLQAAIWAEIFDDLLLRLSERTHRQFIPFDRAADYELFIDGRPRLEGIHAFLRSRGIRLPEGGPADPPEEATVYGLARRKSEALARGLRKRGVSALPGARRYLEAAGRSHLSRAVVSGSTSTMSMLELADLGTLTDACVDADRIRVEHLRSRPAPDVLFDACRLLGVRPGDAVTFTRSAEGVAAGRAAHLTVIGVGDDVTRERLAAAGAERVVPSLGDLLVRSIALAPSASGGAGSPPRARARAG